MSKKDKEKKNIDVCEGERTQDKNPLSPENSAVGDERLKRFPIFDSISKNQSVRTYIQCQNRPPVPGIYEHGFAHVAVVAERTRYILETLGEDDHTIDLALTAAWLHDIGNIVNRVDHSQSGALMAFQILNEMKVPAEDIAQIICAIGNHDEGNGVPVSRISAALILADKSDVRRSRVLNRSESEFDIHDRVNYSVNKSEIKINKEHSGIKLKLHIDTRHER